MRPSPSPTVQALREQYAARLRSLRLSAGMTGRQLAGVLDWQASKISKIEHCAQVPTADDVRAWASACAADSEVAELLAALGAVDGMYVEWRAVQRSGVSRHQRSYHGIDGQTQHFRVYEPGVIPGLLQTREYAHERLSYIAAFRGTPSEEVPATVQARLDRQRVLSTDARFVFVMEQAALRSRIGEVDTMIGQLGHLIAVAARPNVAIGIIPQDIRRTMWSSSGFWIFDDERVRIEILSAELTITQPSEVATYRRAHAALSTMAVTGSAGRQLVLDEIARLTRS